MNQKTIQCRGCMYADIRVEYKYKPISPLSWYGSERNELAIWCEKLHHMVRYPYEQCSNRRERPKIPIDQYR